MMSQNNKLLGATEILDTYQSQPIESLKSKLISFDELSIIAKIYYDNPSFSDVRDISIFNPLQLDSYETQCFDNLYQHLRYLQLEFLDKSELAFYHSVLIVLLRRGYETKKIFKIFENLWQTQSDYLFENLTLRWLVSAADTFVDFSSSALRRAIMMNVTSLINTLKLYETQQYLVTDNQELNIKRVDALYAKHQPLYDGLTFLRLGSDDTIEQMRRRYLAFSNDDAFATQFLLNIFDRLHDNPTAFALFKKMHTEDWGYQW